ncbi:phylloplanin-like [Actinidia eriantha]|uniref:phylloplanin-like n=1 Tax=Actinidia eriantha TaxID=165200 RepID=UPI00258EDFDD|nr:phylloplanin-like [Actinidia eriantha]
MAIKSFLVLVCCFLIIAAMAAPVAKAQDESLDLIRIQGAIYCTANGSIGVNGSATPVFPNARVQLQFGIGNVVSSSTTNASGRFSIILNRPQMPLSTLLSNFNIIVATPLSSCNTSLSFAGGLISTLQFVGSTVLSCVPVNISNLMPVGFQPVP